MLNPSQEHLEPLVKFLYRILHSHPHELCFRVNSIRPFLLLRPIFNISYRTRGGVNPTFSREEIHGMLTSMNYSPISLDNESKPENKHQKTRNNGRDDGQLSLFDIGGVWNDE